MKLNKKILIPILVVVAVLVLFLGFILGRKLYYNNRWHKNTTINGTDVSGMTKEEANKKLSDVTQNYTLSIKARNNGSMAISSVDIDYEAKVGEEYDKLFEQQHSKYPSFTGKSDYSMAYDITYDEVKLNDIIKNCILIKGGASYAIEKPRKAKVRYSKEKMQYVCIPEQNGNKLMLEEFTNTVKKALTQALSTIDISDDELYPNVYKQPKVKSTDPDIQTKVEACNSTVLKYVVWNLGEGLKQEMNPSDIQKWITYEDGNVKINKEKMEEWVEKFCLKYKTVGGKRKVKLHTGKLVEVSGGDYGWQIDYEKTVNEAKQALEKKMNPQDVKNFIADPSKKNKKALTIKYKASYLNKGYKRDLDDLSNDWDENNYTEVSIKDQMVYVFRNKKVAFSCKCITGRPEPGRATPTGTFFVKEHREAYTLTGADYSTPVVNWVRITWTGTGFHPATWQPWSRWSPTYYVSGGSHGCVNLSPSDAKTIYDMVKYQEAVFIH